MNRLSLYAAGSILSVLVLVGLVGGGFFYGVNVGRDREQAANAAAAQQLREAEERIREAVAVAIAGIEVRHTTIRQRAEKEIIREERYRECVHTPGVYGLLNDALADRPAGSNPGAAGLPGADATGRPGVRGNDDEAAGGSAPVSSVQKGGAR